MTDSRTPPSWGRRVSWERGDLLKPVTYASLLHGADAVVHSMGILLEADYKGLVRGQESPLSAVIRAISGAQQKQQKPTTGEGRPQLTYETMNRDSAVDLARAYADAGGRGAFVYVSAAGGAPVLPARYITTKREAEAVIARELAGVARAVFARAPFMYDASRPVTMPLAALTGAGALLNKYSGGILSGFMGAAGAKPLKADVVAEAIVEAVEDDKVRGPVEVRELEELAHSAWRKTML